MSYTGGGCANGQCGISGCTGDDCSEETCANGQCGVATTTNWATTNVKPLATPPPSNALYHPTIVDTTKKSFYCPNILVQGKTIYMKNPEAGYFQLWTPNADGTSPIDNKEGMVEAAWFILNHDWDNEPTNYAFLSHYWEKNFPKKTAGTAVATAAIQTGATAQRNPAVSDQHIVP